MLRNQWLNKLETAEAVVKKTIDHTGPLELPLSGNAQGMGRARFDKLDVATELEATLQSIKSELIPPEITQIETNIQELGQRLDQIEGHIQKAKDFSSQLLPEFVKEALEAKEKIEGEIEDYEQQMEDAVADYLPEDWLNGNCE